MGSSPKKSILRNLPLKRSPKWHFLTLDFMAAWAAELRDDDYFWDPQEGFGTDGEVVNNECSSSGEVDVEGSRDVVVPLSDSLSSGSATLSDVELPLRQPSPPAPDVGSRAAVGCSAGLLPTARDAPGCGPPCRVPGDLRNCPNHVRQVKPVRERKPNRIKKGEGADACPDPAGRDHYPFRGGHFHRRLLGTPVGRGDVQVLFKFCRAVLGWVQHGLSKENRWTFRRKSNAYAWLDENKDVISEEVIEKCLRTLRRNGVT
jgi:hypothetical protein